MSSRVVYREHARDYGDTWNVVDTRPVIRGDSIELLKGPGIISYILAHTENTLIVVTDTARSVNSFDNLAWDTALWIIQDGKFVGKVADALMLKARMAARGILVDDVSCLLKYEDSRYYTLEALEQS